MTTTRLSTKGQLIIPKEVREHFGWGAGTELVVETRGDEIVLRLASDVERAELEDVIGCLRHEGAPRSIEAIGRVRRGEESSETK
ncbi:MAG: AbrB/MazE/SpoVT family DNA-binding domain-containing protein [Acidobacteriota bacterium]